MQMVRRSSEVMGPGSVSQRQGSLRRGREVNPGRVEVSKASLRGESRRSEPIDARGRCCGAGKGTVCRVEQIE
jgi:hypothetical protein